MEINKEINKFLEETEWGKQQAEALRDPMADPNLIPKITFAEQAIMDGIRLILKKLNPEHKLTEEVAEIEKEVVIEPCRCGKPGIFRKDGDHYLNDTDLQYCKECWEKHCEGLKRINTKKK